MKKLLLFSLLLLLLPELIKSQDFQDNRFPILKSIKLKNSQSNVDSNLQNFPFRFGAELAVGIPFHSRSTLIPGIIGFTDINLSSKIAFLKIEFGEFFDANSGNNHSLYISLGINYKILDFKQNKFYVHGAIFAGYGFSAFLSMRHLYAFNKYFGIVSSIRYPFGAFDTILFTTGFQFFTE